MFGRTQSAQLLMQTPPCVLRPKAIALRDPRDVIRDPRAPLVDPIRMRNPALGRAAHALLTGAAEQEPRLQPLVEPIVQALSTGAAALDANSAAALLDFIAEHRR